MENNLCQNVESTNGVYRREGIIMRVSTLTDHEIFLPHEYQSRAIEQALERNELGLFLEMGLGKTVTMLTVVNALLRSSKPFKTLIIAPLRVATCTWSTEAQKWDHVAHMRISRVLGTQSQRINALKSDADIYVINRENVCWLIDYHTKNGIDWNFECVIVDELSSFKCPKSKRFKSLKIIRNKVKRFYGLTGTPASNGVKDLWAQMYLIDKGKSLGENYYSFLEKYFIKGKYDWRPKKNAVEDITSKISRSVISITAKDCAMEISRIDNVVSVELDDTDKKTIKNITSKLFDIDNLQDKKVDDDIVIKAMQIANGAVYVGDEVIVLHDKKLDALEEIIEINNGNNILLFYAFKHDADRIKQKFPHAKKLETESDINDWNAGNLTLAIVHPASCGHGVNLQSGGHIMVWYGLTYSLELYQQACARLARQGQSETVVVHHIITKDTVDEDVYSALQQKDITQSKIIEAVKRRGV